MAEHKTIGYALKPPAGYKKTGRRRVLYILAYAVSFLALIIPPILRIDGTFFAAMTLVGAGVVFLEIRITWPRTKPEIDYQIEFGVFYLANIYGGRVRRSIIEFEVSEAELIAPLNGVYDGRLRDYAPEREYMGVFTKEQANYFVLIRDEDEVESVVYIYADEETVKVLKRCNGRTMVR